MNMILTNAISRFKSAHRIVRFSTYLAITYLIYALLTGLALPVLLEAKTPAMIKEFIGRDVAIGEVKINPFLLRFEVNQFSISESDNQNSFVSIAQIKAEFNFWESLLSLTPTLEYFYVTEPELRLARLSRIQESFRFNFSDIPEYIESNAKGDKPLAEVAVAEEQPSGLFAFRAHLIELQNGRLRIKDQITGASLGYHSVNLELANLDTQAFSIRIPENQNQGKAQANLAPAANSYRLSLKGTDNSQLESDGQFQLNSLEVAGDIELNNMQLAPLWPLTENVISAELASGAINLFSRYHLRQQEQKINFSSEEGHFLVSGLAFNYKEEPRVKFANFSLDEIRVSTENATVDIASMQLDQLWISAILDKAGVDLQNYFIPESSADNNKSGHNSSHSTATTAPAGAVKDTVDTSQPWLVTLNRFALNNADINLQEKRMSDGVFWRVFGLNFSTGRLATDLSAPVDYQVNFDIGSAYKKQPEKSQGKYQSQGRLDAKALTLESDIQLSGLQLKQFQRYIDPYLNIILSKGELDVKGNIQGSADGELIFQGNSVIEQFLVKDGLEKEPLVQWKKVSVDSIDFNKAKNALKINSILFDELFSKVILTKDQKTNVGELSRDNKPVTTESDVNYDSQSLSAKTAKEKSTQDDSNTIALDIDKIVIRNGSAFFADYSLTPNFASGIELMNGEISNISSNPSARAKVDISGKIDKYAPVKLSGQVNPLAVPPYLDLDFSVESAELTSVNTYSGTYAGYYIDKGLLSLTVNYKLENNLLEGKNHVVVDQLTLGKQSESDLATSLPVSLAVGLLKDSDGVIDLGFGVSGDVNSPDFSFGGAIFTVIGNIITKAITAPFSLLASLVGSDDDLDFVEFEPGSDKIDSLAQNRLDKLAEALTARPGLNISVEGSVLAVEDANILAEQEFHSKLQKVSGVDQLPADLSASRISDFPELVLALETLFAGELQQDVVVEREKMNNLLNEQKQSEETVVAPEELNQALNISMYNQLLSAQDVGTNDLGNLAQSRAKAVKAYLVEKEIAPGRIFILDSKAKLKTEDRKALMTIEVD